MSSVQELLHLACTSGTFSQVKMLLGLGGDPNLVSHGLSPLYIAAQNGHADIVALLIENGAIVDIPLSTGETPLFSACQKGHYEVAELLIKKGAFVDYHEPSNEETPLYIAALDGHAEIVKLLIKNGACVDSPAKFGATPLWAASLQGHEKVVDILLRLGNADANKPETTDSISPLHVATTFGHTEVVKTLLQSGNVNTSATTISGLTPLDIAIRKNLPDIIGLLKEH